MEPQSNLVRCEAQHFVRIWRSIWLAATQHDANAGVSLSFASRIRSRPHTVALSCRRRRRRRRRSSRNASRAVCRDLNCYQ